VVHLGVAHTSHGDIPCKIQGNTAWYPYGGSEHTTHDFSYVQVNNHALLRNAGAPPVTAIACGRQNDGAGTLYAAIAHTSHGDIPAKAQGNTAWFPYGGKEHTTHDFSWVIQAWSLHHVNNGPVAHSVAGHQNDGAGTVYLAVAHTSHGDIPGKAQGNNCWYPYGGSEHSTNNFSWVASVSHRLTPTSQSAHPPANAIRCGHQNDGAGDLYAAIAHTSHGNIPGKAQGNNCWYPYGGSEHSNCFLVPFQGYFHGTCVQ
jgi:hypothetical protein